MFTKVIKFSKSTSKIKAVLQWTLLLILRTSAVIQHLNFLDRKAVVQFLLNYKCHRCQRPHFEKALLRKVKTETL